LGGPEGVKWYGAEELEAWQTVDEGLSTACDGHQAGESCGLRAEGGIENGNRKGEQRKQGKERRRGRTVRVRCE